MNDAPLSTPQFVMIGHYVSLMQEICSWERRKEARDSQNGDHPCIPSIQYDVQSLLTLNITTYNGVKSGYWSGMLRFYMLVLLVGMTFIQPFVGRSGEVVRKCLCVISQLYPENSPRMCGEIFSQSILRLISRGKH